MYLLIESCGAFGFSDWSICNGKHTVCYADPKSLVILDLVRLREVVCCDYVMCVCMCTHVHTYVRTYVRVCVCVHTSVPCGSLLLSGSIVSGADEVCYYRIEVVR